MTQQADAKCNKEAEYPRKSSSPTCIVTLSLVVDTPSVSLPSDVSTECLLDEIPGFDRKPVSMDVCTNMSLAVSYGSIALEIFCF